MYLMYLDMFDAVCLWCSLVNMLVPAFVPADYLIVAYPSSKQTANGFIQHDLVSLCKLVLLYVTLPETNSSVNVHLADFSGKYR